jgi:hypothetical protein
MSGSGDCPPPPDRAANANRTNPPTPQAHSPDAPLVYLLQHLAGNRSAGRRESNLTRNAGPEGPIADSEDGPGQPNRLPGSTNSPTRAPFDVPRPAAAVFLVKQTQAQPRHLYYFYVCLQTQRFRPDAERIARSSANLRLRNGFYVSVLVSRFHSLDVIFELSSRSRPKCGSRAASTIPVGRWADEASPMPAYGNLVGSGLHE